MHADHYDGSRGSVHPRHPALEMLWETAEPAHVLATRFGHDDGDAARTWLTGLVGEHWGIEVLACRRIVMSDCNALAWLDTSSGGVVAKWSVARDRFARLAALTDLTAWLAAQGQPVSAPVAAPSGRTHLTTDGVFLALQREIDASPLEVSDLGAVHDAGAALARLHRELAAYPGTGRVRDVSPDPGPSTVERVTAWFATPPPHVPVPLLDALRRRLDDTPAAPLPVQLLHGDVRAANLLCAQGRVRAVIDLEEARFDTAVDELARGAVLLGTKYHRWGPVSPLVRATFRAGYETVRPLAPDEARWWDVLVGAYSLLMIPPAEGPTGWRAAAEVELLGS